MYLLYYFFLSFLFCIFIFLSFAIFPHVILIWGPKTVLPVGNVRGSGYAVRRFAFGSHGGTRGRACPLSTSLLYATWPRQGFDWIRWKKMACEVLLNFSEMFTRSGSVEWEAA